MALSHPSRRLETGSGATRARNSSGRTARGLYAITPDRSDTARLVAQVECILPHATWLQYRNKTAPPTLRREQLDALLPHCRAHGVPLIVNDDWRLAADCGADGVHLGEDDEDLHEARTALGASAILGASCYDSVALAERAVAAGASYVAFGAFFPTSTKATTRRATTVLLQATAGIGVPRVAIGGITPENAPSLVSAGADLLAVISGVFDAPDPVAAARAYVACFPPP